GTHVPVPFPFTAPTHDSPRTHGICALHVPPSATPFGPQVPHIEPSSPTWISDGNTQLLDSHCAEFEHLEPPPRSPVPPHPTKRPRTSTRSAQIGSFGMRAEYIGP